MVHFDPLVSSPPALNDAVVRRILQENFGPVSSLTALSGERDQNFLVNCADGQRILFKISNPADELSVLEMQSAALRHIEHVDPGLPVMRVLPTLAGEPWLEISGPDGRAHLARIFTFLPGRTASGAALTTQAIRSFGQTTARLGRALRGFFHPAADYEILWDLTNAPKLRPLLSHISDAARRDQVERVLDRFETRVQPVLPGLRAQVIHADMSLGNVLLDDSLRVSGIVDFGDMTHAPLVCDLAVAVADVLHSRVDAADAAEAMIGGYVSVTPLEDDEAELLADLVATRLATGVTVVAWRRGLYPEQAAHSVYSANGASGSRTFLDIIEETGIDAIARRFREVCRGV